MIKDKEKDRRPKAGMTNPMSVEAGNRTMVRRPRGDGNKRKTPFTPNKTRLRAKLGPQAAMRV